MTYMRTAAPAFAILGIMSLDGGQSALAQDAGATQNQKPAERDVATQAVTLNIPSLPLGKALNEFARQSGLQIMLYTKAGEGVIAPSVVGSYTPSKALALLLTHAQLRVQWLNKHTIALHSQDNSRTSADPEAAVGDSDLKNLRLSQSAVYVFGVDEAAEAGTGASEKNSKKSSDGVEEMVVEESKIKPYTDPNADIPRTINDVQPYYIFDSKTIERAGAPNIEAFLKQRLTMNTQARTNNQAYASSLGNTSSFNLRGLGVDGTLILVNGRRLPSVTNTGSASSTLQADINGIPMSAIDRIEVLPSSASGIYGGNAVGGVINVILKRDYEGGELQYTYENTTDTDAPTSTANATYGTSLEGGRTRLMLSASYSLSEPLLLQDRLDVYARGIDIILRNAPSMLNSPSSPFQGATTNIASLTYTQPYNTLNGAIVGDNLVLKDGRQLNSPFTSLAAGITPTTSTGTVYDGLLANAGTYNLNLANGTGGRALQNQLGTTADTKSLRFSLQRQMTPWLDVFVDASTTVNAGNSLYSPFTNFVTYVPATSVSNPFRQDLFIHFPSNISMPLDTESTNHAVTAGLTLKLPLSWVAQMEYGWSQNRFTNFSTGDIDYEAMRAWIDDGTFNPFVDVPVYPQRLLELLAPQRYSSVSGLDDYNLRASGPLAAFSWGSPTLTAGLEHRKSGYEPNVQVQSYPITKTKNSQTVYFGQSQFTDSLYAELNVPLVTSKNAMPFMRSLELQVTNRRERYVVDTGTTSARYEGDPLRFVGYSPTPPNGVPFRSQASYSNSSLTTGLKYKPVEDLAFRASYAQAFRPPTYSQLLPNPIPSAPSTAAIFDPVLGINYAGYRTLSGGNPELEPMRAKNLNLGLIYEPNGGMSGVRVGLEYYRIAQFGYITSLTAQQLIDDPTFVARLTRDPVTRRITLIDRSSINANKFETAGWDMTLNYRKSTGLGDLDFYAAMTYINYEKRQTTRAKPTLDYVGFPNSGGEASTKANATLTWQRANWAASWTTTFFGSYKQQGAAGDPNNPLPAGSTNALLLAAQGSDHIASQMFHDVFASYEFGNTTWGERGTGWMGSFFDNVTIQAGVRNVFNTLPRYDSYFGSFYYSPYGDLRLRNYRLSLKKSF